MPKLRILSAADVTNELVIPFCSAEDQPPFLSARVCRII